ncbi:hypothetical protein AAG570_000105 [Ranatra chinensis]|uniref:Phosphoserine aminotransferase n=1 Tax=Ranatra chinensis TaxID=642074 RepID=A0ABD0ZD19_9HEMI
MSHRSSHYEQINNQAQETLRHILDVPDNYKILFMQGGGTGIFAAVALNLISKTGSADYVVTGSWSAKAANEAKKYGKVNLVLPPRDNYLNIPDQSTWSLDPNASYIYYCANETINGIEFPYIPEAKGIPLVADMSSNFLSKPINVSKFGVIFASAQKNIGPAGITVVIIRDDLLDQPMPSCPSILDFTIMAKFNSLYNTPPCFCAYVMGKVFKWIDKNGGVKGMEVNAVTKSSMLYSTIDDSNGFYSCPISKDVRSRMNVPFRITGQEELEQLFLEESKKAGMIQLKGHRSVGGLRASLYNAVSISDTKVLTDFMAEFRAKYHK